MMRTRAFIPRKRQRPRASSIRVRKYIAVGTRFGDHLFGDLMVLWRMRERRTRHVDIKIAP